MKFPSLALIQAREIIRHIVILSWLLCGGTAMARWQGISIFAASIVVAAGTAGPVFAQPGSAPLPPNQTAHNSADTDLGCRKQAAAQTGYSGSNPSDEVQKEYADAYYACMDQAYGPPGPPTGSAYGPPGPQTGSAYGPPPPPYYYPPYPYPYYGPYYYPPYYYGPGYYGPGVVFGFGFHRR
jgi:hypothetical protein